MEHMQIYRVYFFQMISPTLRHDEMFTMEHRRSEKAADNTLLFEDQIFINNGKIIS